MSEQCPTLDRYGTLINASGLGFFVYICIIPMYIHRLFQYGLPAPNLRPGMYIAVGPPSFTGLALIGLSQALHPALGPFLQGPDVIVILQTMATIAAIFLWCLSFWFFCISTLPVLSGARKMKFHLTWWALVFPNSGWTISTIYIGRQLHSEGILWVASAMTILLVVAWIFVFVNHVRAVLSKEIMMPGKDEDKGKATIRLEGSVTDSVVDEYKDHDREHGIHVPP